MSFQNFISHITHKINKMKKLRKEKSGRKEEDSTMIHPITSHVARKLRKGISVYLF